jgi:hypothetical protein
MFALHPAEDSAGIRIGLVLIQHSKGAAISGWRIASLTAEAVGEMTLIGIARLISNARKRGA